ncbi:MAG: hypothetical protein LBD23_00765 [Oscillospiraceae bacterium]|jgi:hypothetical protein|nr:hypothetical protein [Oscillospiraceae bacterium]
MSIIFKYEFYDKGTSIKKVPEGHIWLDIGNALAPGIIDHHSSTGYSSTVDALQKNLHLLDDLKNRETVVINTHKFPDTDALFSMWLVQYYLKDSRYELPRNIAAIVEYVSNIDSGHVKLMDDTITLYKILGFQATEYHNEAAIKKCLDIIKEAIDLNDRVGFSFMNGNILEHMDGCDEITALIENDRHRYEIDKNTICRKVQVTLPLSGNYTTAATEEVDAIIWTTQPTSKFNRLWARSDGYVLTIVPQEDKSYFFDDKDILCTDTIISIGPEFASKYSLIPLAYMLEQYEQEKELSVLGEENNTKRDHSCPRGKEKDDNRFFDKPWSLTADPWYFTNDGTLVQSPYNGSLLSLREVIQTVLTFAECFIKNFRMNILVPFTYDPLSFDQVLKSFYELGWEKSDIPWLDKNERYISTFLQEYSFKESEDNIKIREREKHFVVLKLQYSQGVFQPDANCSHHADDCVFKALYKFDKPLTCILFKYGAGIAVFSHSADLSGQRMLAVYEVEKLRSCQRKFIDHFHKCPLFTFKPVDCLSPHYYTSIEVNSGCLNMSSSLISRFAVSLCNIADSGEDFGVTQKINYRTMMAHSRMGSTLVIATDEFDKYDSNKGEYAYRDRFNNEWLYLYIIALQQRYSLVEIKRCFTSLLGANNCKDTKKLREKLIGFYASSYFTTVTDDELGDNIYSRWHKVLMIDDLKMLIMEEINQHDEYISGKTAALFQKVSNWLIPVMIMSTLTQIFVNWHLFLGVWHDGDIGTWMEWFPVIIPFGLVAIIIWLKNLFKK